ncbi:MAG: DUF4254 domain-containing protein, partial [Pleurocapsa sp. SU_196_0]|nr:DUF4254 domain-containing protein [Pleurocapsa sp. SU_196_0]
MRIRNRFWCWRTSTAATRLGSRTRGGSRPTLPAWRDAEDLAKRVELSLFRAPASAPQNTETPGSAIDRLSILSLRIFHMQEQCERSDVTSEHLETVRGKLKPTMAAAFPPLAINIESSTRPRNRVTRLTALPISNCSTIGC